MTLKTGESSGFVRIGKPMIFAELIVSNHSIGKKERLPLVGGNHRREPVSQHTECAAHRRG